MLDAVRGVKRYYPESDRLHRRGGVNAQQAAGLTRGQRLPGDMFADEAASSAAGAPFRKHRNEVVCSSHGSTASSGMGA